MDVAQAGVLCEKKERGCEHRTVNKAKYLLEAEVAEGCQAV
jgi:hypothetical protein